jgi:hypothetical protein
MVEIAAGIFPVDQTGDVGARQWREFRMLGRAWQHCTALALERELHSEGGIIAEILRNARSHLINALYQGTASQAARKSSPLQCFVTKHDFRGC